MNPKFEILSGWKSIPVAAVRFPDTSGKSRKEVTGYVPAGAPARLPSAKRNRRGAPITATFSPVPLRYQIVTEGRFGGPFL